MTTSETSFGEYLKSLRVAQRLSRPQVRDKVRDTFGASKAFSTSTLENWENGALTGMSAGSLACLVVALGADYEEVFRRLAIAQGADPVVLDLARKRPRVEDAASPRSSRSPGKRPGNGSKRRAPE